jgi:hypothetical protein
MSWQARAAGRTDPLLAFYWDIQFQTPAGTIPPEYVESVQVPLPKYDSDHAVFQARKYYFAKFEDYGVANCRFYVDVNTRVVTWLRNWQKLIKDADGNYNTPSKYKGTIFVQAKDPTDATTTQFTCFGVFPTQVPVIPFDSTGERITLDVEFSIDRTEVG